MTAAEIRAKAIENYTTIHDSETDQVRFVEAEAKTGSRYVVVATRLGEIPAMRAGNSMLVTVLQPWQDAWTIYPQDVVDERYVAEHFTDGRGYDGRLHPGDLVALTMAIAQAIGGRAAVSA